MEQINTTFEAFESIKKNGLNSETDRLRFVEKQTSGFKLPLLYALKNDLDNYIQDSLLGDATNKYKQYRKENNPTWEELTKSAYSDIEVHGYTSTHEAWRLVFDKITRTWFDLDDPLFYVMIDFLNLETFIWEEITKGVNKKENPGEENSSVSRKGLSVEMLLRQILKSRTDKLSSKWKEDTMYRFLLTAHNYQGLSAERQRELALEAETDQYIINELNEVPRSTLYDWRKTILNKL